MFIKYKFKVLESMIFNNRVGKRGGISMTTRELVSQYVEVLCKIYGKHLKTVILYGSYARAIIQRTRI